MKDDFALHTARIAVVGLGYVGLPLAVEFGKLYDTVGFDIDAARVEQLHAGRDDTLEVEPELLASATRLRFSAKLEEIRDCNVFIVTVPTPINAAKRPDLTPLIKASEAIGSLLKPGDVVIYESTVYPGCTEEVCVPILEKISGLTFATDCLPLPFTGEGRGEGARKSSSHEPIDSFAASSLSTGEDQGERAQANTHFYCGYSPERINPGDKQHRLTNILKVTSGSTPEAATFVDNLYKSIITAGTHKASSIKVAEAAKVIENTQRDLNIALVNDLAILFNKLGIDTLEVLEAAGTKWNFLPFRPGLVGGHCIGVDPYYLTHKAQEVGHHPDVILAGRRTNDGMGAYIASEVIRLMVRKGLNPVKARVLILGLAFKENCPDLRNTRVVDIVHALNGYSAQVDICDPWVSAAEAQREYGLALNAQPGQGSYDAIVVAVAHHQFAALGAEGIRAYGKPDAIVYDVKYVLPREQVDGRL